MKAAAFQYKGKTITIVSNNPTSSTIYLDAEKRKVNCTDIKFLKSYTKALVEGENDNISNNSY